MKIISIKIKNNIYIIMSISVENIFLIAIVIFLLYNLLYNNYDCFNVGGKGKCTCNTWTQPNTRNKSYCLDKTSDPNRHINRKSKYCTDQTTEENCNTAGGRSYIGPGVCEWTDEYRTCPRMRVQDNAYTQMKKCYSASNPKCKFKYGDIYNECLIDKDPDLWGCWAPSRQGDTWIMNYPLPGTGVVGGWGNIGASGQKEMCELYGNMRNLPCKFYERDFPKTNYCSWEDADEKNKWFGTAPFCKGECNEDFPVELIRDDGDGPGDTCDTGSKVLCGKKPSQKNLVWCGDAPFCDGKCPQGCRLVTESDRGDGSECWSGDKVLCDCTGIKNTGCQ